MLRIAIIKDAEPTQFNWKDAVLDFFEWNMSYSGLTNLWSWRVVVQEVVKWQRHYIEIINIEYIGRCHESIPEDKAVVL